MNERTTEASDLHRSVRPGDSDHSERPAAPASWIVEVTTAGDRGSFASSGQRFTSEEGAKRYAADLAMRWTAVVDWRVVPSDDAPTDGRSEQWAERGAVRPDADAPAWRVQL